LGDVDPWNGSTTARPLALHILGWKIVCITDPEGKWPWFGDNKNWRCPDWCDDGKGPKKPGLVLAFDRDKPDKT